jgi:hypothetical protein
MRERLGSPWVIAEERPSCPIGGQVEDYNAKAALVIAQRTAELQRFLENKRLELNMEQKKAREEMGAASTEMQER